MNTHTNLFHRLRCLTSAALLVVLILGTLPEDAYAAQAWNPTLLVNTESKIDIPAGDATTNIELFFGTALDARLFYDIGNSRFNFTKSVWIQGSLTATGSITTKGTLSGQNLIVSGVSSFSGASTFKSNLTSKGTLSGQNLIVSGVSSHSGAAVFKSTVTVKGNLSGATLIVSGASSFSGTALFKSNLGVKGALSGATFYGSGLGQCNGASQKLIYDQATGKFGCGTDLNTGTSPPPSVNTGGVLQLGGIYVRKSGDTMTGALTINGTGSPAVGLDVKQGAWVNTLHATGSILSKGTISGQTLIVSGVSSQSGAATFKSTVTVKSTLSGQTLRVTGNADVHGALTVTGAIRTDGNITINDDADTNDAVLNFGNTSGTQTLKFLNAGQKFQFSRGISVVGGISGSYLTIDGNSNMSGALTVKGNIRGQSNISGSTLTVDGNVTLHGITYTAPSAQGAVNTVLKNDGNGTLTWSRLIDNGSGSILSLHPEYPNHVYYYSGATFVGQLTASGGNIGQNENFYHWTSTRSGIQDYWIAVRVRIPDNFSAWDPIKSIQLRYRTKVGGPASTTTNHLTLRVIDSAGLTIDGTGALTNNAFTTANIPLATGTWTPKTNMTVLIKMASTSSGFAEAGFLNLNWETTTP